MCVLGCMRLSRPVGCACCNEASAHPCFRGCCLQVVDMFGLLLHPLLFYAWMYVLTLTPVPAWSYFTTLVAVGFYTSGIGYLVRRCHQSPWHVIGM